VPGRALSPSHRPGCPAALLQCLEAPSPPTHGPGPLQPRPTLKYPPSAQDGPQLLRTSHHSPLLSYPTSSTAWSSRSSQRPPGSGLYTASRFVALAKKARMSLQMTNRVSTPPYCRIYSCVSAALPMALGINRPWSKKGGRWLHWVGQVGPRSDTLALGSGRQLACSRLVRRTSRAWRMACMVAPVVQLRIFWPPSLQAWRS
jgi:hypothetical protein